MKTNTKKNEFVFIHFARYIAAFAVVLFHVIGGMWTNDPNADPAFDKTVDLLRLLLQWHVPVFYIITGYIWLNKEKECTYRIVFPHVIRLVTALVVFGFTYSLMEQFFEYRIFEFRFIIRAFLDLITGELWDHMWYMYSVIGLYLLLPLIKPFFDFQSTKNVCIATAVIFLFARLIPSAFESFGRFAPFQFPIERVSFFYLMIGGLVSRGKFSSKQSMCFVGAFLGSSVLLSMNHLLDWNLVIISNVCVTLGAVFIFCFFAAAPCFNRENAVIKSVSKCTFGIYLIHPVFINLITKLLHFYPYQHYPFVSIPMIAIAIFAVSWGTVFVLRKIPIIKNRLL